MRIRPRIAHGFGQNPAQTLSQKVGRFFTFSDGF
jgi:hypothetical protein